ncbi:hypothetical protein [Hymenobacter glacialis]|nr:hypothetical protein [Hymenobacter glacialis]
MPSIRPLALACVVASALAGSLLLSGCSSEPTATEVDKTATVVSSETNQVSDSAATVVDADTVVNQ